MAKILIIDDDESIRELIARILAKKQYEILEAPNGDIGLKIFEENTIDLVITDVIMEYSGFNVIKNLNNQKSKVPIIAITGSLLSAAILQEDYSVSHTLVKPFGKDSLIKAVGELLNSEQNK